MLDIDHVFETLQNHTHCISILIFSHKPLPNYLFQHGVLQIYIN